MTSALFEQFKKEVEEMDSNLEVKPFFFGFARVYYRTPSRYLYVTEVPMQMGLTDYKIRAGHWDILKKAKYMLWKNRVDKIARREMVVRGYLSAIDEVRKKVFYIKNLPQMIDSLERTTVGLYV